MFTTSIFSPSRLTPPLLKRCGEKGWVAGAWTQVPLVALAMSCFALSQRLDGSGFIALSVQLAIAVLAAGVVYLLYSRLVRLPELPRTIDLLRSARRSG